MNMKESLIVCIVLISFSGIIKRQNKIHNTLNIQEEDNPVTFWCS